MEELLRLAKQTLGIVSTATANDEMIKNIIASGVEDIRRTGIEVNLGDAMVKNTIMIYVKANYGLSNPDDKAKFNEAYQLHLSKLSLSKGDY